MQQHKGVFLEIKVEYPIVARTKLPNIFFKVFGNIIWQTSTFALQQFNVQADLLILYAGIFIGGSLIAQSF